MYEWLFVESKIEMTEYYCRLINFKTNTSVTQLARVVFLKQDLKIWGVHKNLNHIGICKNLDMRVHWTGPNSEVKVRDNFNWTLKVLSLTPEWYYIYWFFNSITTYLVCITYQTQFFCRVSGFSREQCRLKFFSLRSLTFSLCTQLSYCFIPRNLTIWTKWLNSLKFTVYQNCQKKKYYIWLVQ